MFNTLKEKYFDEIKKLRRDLHRIPEEGLKEFKTSRYIKDYLTDLGLEYEETAGTGVLCYIDMGSETTYAFRTDMDGLSIVENNDIDFKSTNPDMMHACGHDGHMSILLIFAKYLSENKDKLKDSILLIFQPAEEGPGGAKLIIKEGVLKKYNVKNVFALHLSPNVPKGKYSSKPYGFYAASTEFTVFIDGKSSHGAAPHNGVDAIVIASQYINGIQSIVSRNINPIREGLVTIGTINGGDRINIIAEHVEMEGTIRTLDKDTYKIIDKRMHTLAEGLSEAYDCKITYDWRPFYGITYNDKELYEKVVPAFKDDYILGDAILSAEDFSFYSEEVPCFFYELGIREEDKGYVHPLHNACFNFDEESLLYGVMGDINILKTLGAIE
ncbi:M20 metallopeptidase family protein [Anaerofustis stercorihominis]|uniref:M20 metallopeptidase family protein n=1 Tax=Anaerofustis stercorihominis TaxID=214853 RepID=UPI00214AB080|nr:M20 family metallopeptidase [Anaerofustis stercorihominis]MCR2033047.1 M20 family metallopeptidase [Anaerofustis stercorihominis]